MSKFVFINNKVVPEKSATISVFDRSYLYGEGVFETLRAYEGRLPFVDLHYERLKKNCKRLGIDVPVDRAGFEKAIKKTLAANNIKNASIRVTLSPIGASHGIAKPKNMRVNFSIFCSSYTGRAKELYSKGARVIIIKDVPCDHPSMADIKSTNYLNKMLARDQVIKFKADEGVFCTPEGKVLEGSATNIFIVKNKNVITPPISDGILAGVTRNVVLNLAEGKGLDVRESTITMDDLKNSDEIFLTGTTTEILPVKEFIKFCEKKSSPGPVTTELMQAYKDLLP